MRTSYFIKEALINFKRGGIASYAACATITTTLVILGTFLFVTVNINTVLTLLAKKTSLVVYLKDNLTQSQLAALKKEITLIPNIDQVRYVSKNEALERFKSDLKAINKEKILDGLPRNPLPDSFEIKIKSGRGFSWEDFEEAAEIISKLPHVGEVDYGQQVVGLFNKITKILKLIILAVALILSLATLIIIIDTIELTLFAREKEIFLLRIIGATNWFIRWPYLLEGALQGFIGGSLAILILFGGYKLIMNKMSEVGTLIFPVRFLPPEGSIVLIIMSLFIAILGSFISVQMFLRQKKSE